MEDSEIAAYSKILLGLSTLRTKNKREIGRDMQVLSYHPVNLFSIRTYTHP